MEELRRNIAELKGRNGDLISTIDDLNRKNADLENRNGDLKRLLEQTRDDRIKQALYENQVCIAQMGSDLMVSQLSLGNAFELFDDDVCKCIAQCTAVDTSDHAWHQARLSQSREAIVLETRLLSLSSKLDDHLFKVLLDVFSIADKARLLSVSSRNAASWLSVTPSEGLCLHLDPSQFQVAIKWWLGLEVSYGSCCPLCPDIALEPT
eukprot:Em0002g1346a